MCGGGWIAYQRALMWRARETRRCGRGATGSGLSDGRVLFMRKRGWAEIVPVWKDRRAPYRIWRTELHRDCEQAHRQAEDHKFFGREFTTVVAYSDASYKKQRRSYEKRKSSNRFRYLPRDPSPHRADEKYMVVSTSYWTDTLNVNNS